MAHTLGPLDGRARHLVAGHLLQQVGDAVQPRLLLVHRLRHPPPRLGDVGALEHRFLGRGAGLPAAAAFQVHGAELPLLQRVMDAAESGQGHHAANARIQALRDTPMTPARGVMNDINCLYISRRPAVPARKSLPSKPPAPPAAAKPRPSLKAAPKPAGKPAAKATPPAGPARPPKAAKEPKAAKPPKVRQKPVRDSFTMPEADFSLVATLKARALAAKRETKKSELLRAGLHALAAMDSAALLAALQALEPIKTGRPKKGH
jgi:hypothetical protein